MRVESSRNECILLPLDSIPIVSNGRKEKYRISIKLTFNTKKYNHTNAIQVVIFSLWKILLTFIFS